MKNKQNLTSKPIEVDIAIFGSVEAQDILIKNLKKENDSTFDEKTFKRNVSTIDQKIEFNSQKYTLKLWNSSSIKDDQPSSEDNKRIAHTNLVAVAKRNEVMGH